MPVMVFYKDKTIPTTAANDVIQELADITEAELQAKIEVRVVEPIQTYNANEVHIEVRFRDFGEYTDQVLQNYHDRIMAGIGKALKKHKLTCQYSFYIVPTMPPRSIWAQNKS